MPVRIVGNEKTVAELADRMFDRVAATPETRARMEGALSAANRAVDFRKLKPGMVLNIPAGIGVLRKDKERPTDEPAGLRERYGDALRAGEARVMAGLVTEDREDAQMAALLESRELQAYAKRQPALRPLIEATSRALAERAEERKRQGADFKQLFALIEADFDRLMKRSEQ